MLLDVSPLRAKTSTFDANIIATRHLDEDQGKIREVLWGFHEGNMVV